VRATFAPTKAEVNITGKVYFGNIGSTGMLVSMTPGEPQASVASGRRGRRLSEDRSDIILESVLELLEECGYDQLRMQDIADRANVGLSTIYRRWPTKQEVVGAALECKQERTSWPTTDDPRADVQAMLLDMAEHINGDGGELLLGLLATMRSEPDVGEMFRRTMLDGLHEHLRARLAVALGEDDPDLDLRAAAGPAILVYQRAICGQPVDAAAMAERLTHLLFAPAPD
jgi:AcrR family transcriptional regulator